MIESSLTVLPTIKQVIDQHGLQATKKLGQNFLTDLNLTQKIVSFAGTLDGVHAIEVGPGPGALTRPLLASKARDITVIELDTRCVPILAQLAQHYPDRLHVVMGDALKQDITALTPAPRTIIANLPYNVATPLLIHWLGIIHGDSAALQSMTLMFQKEVAERITAEPDSKAYGRLSVISQWLCDVDICFDISPSAFLPPPKVTSSVVHFRPLAKPRFAADKATLEKVVSAAFGQRRKMLRAALKSLTPHAEALLEQADIIPTRRAETLSVEEFCRLANVFAAPHIN